MLATKAIGSYLDLGTARGAFCFAAPTERKRLGGARCRRKSANSGRVLKLLMFVIGQYHGDRIFIDAKKLGASSSEWLAGRAAPRPADGFHGDIGPHSTSARVRSFHNGTAASAVSGSLWALIVSLAS